MVRPTLDEIFGQRPSLDEIFAEKSAKLKPLPEEQKAKPKGVDYWEVAKAGLEGFGEGIEGGINRAINAASFGGYDWLNRKFLGDQYGKQQRELQQRAESANVGGLNTIANLLTDIGSGGATTGNVAYNLAGKAGLKGLGQLIGAGALEGSAWGATASDTLDEAATNIPVSTITGGIVGGGLGAVGNALKRFSPKLSSIGLKSGLENALTDDETVKALKRGALDEGIANQLLARESEVKNALNTRSADALESLTGQRFDVESAKQANRQAYKDYFANNAEKMVTPEIVGEQVVKERPYSNKQLEKMLQNPQENKEAILDVYNNYIWDYNPSMADRINITAMTDLGMPYKTRPKSENTINKESIQAQLDNLKLPKMINMDYLERILRKNNIPISSKYSANTGSEYINLDLMNTPFENAFPQGTANISIRDHFKHSNDYVKPDVDFFVDSYNNWQDTMVNLADKLNLKGPEITKARKFVDLSNELKNIDKSSSSVNKKYKGLNDVLNPSTEFQKESLAKAISEAGKMTNSKEGTLAHTNEVKKALNDMIDSSMTQGSNMQMKPTAKTNQLMELKTKLDDLLRQNSEIKNLDTEYSRLAKLDDAYQQGFNANPRSKVNLTSDEQKTAFLKGVTDNILSDVKTDSDLSRAIMNKQNVLNKAMGENEYNQLMSNVSDTSSQYDKLRSVLNRARVTTNRYDDLISADKAREIGDSKYSAPLYYLAKAINSVYGRTNRKIAQQIIDGAQFDQQSALLEALARANPAITGSFINQEILGRE